jgi:hypothetical protein
MYECARTHVRTHARTHAYAHVAWVCVWCVCVPMYTRTITHPSPCLSNFFHARALARSYGQCVNARTHSFTRAHAQIHARARTRTHPPTHAPTHTQSPAGAHAPAVTRACVCAGSGPGPGPGAGAGASASRGTAAGGRGSSPAAVGGRGNNLACARTRTHTRTHTHAHRSMTPARHPLHRPSLSLQRGSFCYQPTRDTARAPPSPSPPLPLPLAASLCVRRQPHPGDLGSNPAAVGLRGLPPAAPRDRLGRGRRGATGRGCGACCATRTSTQPRCGRRSLSSASQTSRCADCLSLSIALSVCLSLTILASPSEA